MSWGGHPGARQALEEFREEVRRVYPELIALVAYGSVVGENFREGHSDVNLLLVLPQVDAAVLARGAAALRSHRRKNRVLPLLLSAAELGSACDVFAVELSDIKERHIVLCGQDPFETISVPAEALRRQCEFELRGKLLRLRQGYLEAEGREKLLVPLMAQVLSGVLPLGRSLLRLAGLRTPHRRTEQIQALAGQYGFPAGVWLEVLELMERRRSRPLRPAEGLYADFLASLDHLVRRVDDAT